MRNHARPTAKNGTQAHIDGPSNVSGCLRSTGEDWLTAESGLGQGRPIQPAHSRVSFRRLSGRGAASPTRDRPPGWLSPSRRAAFGPLASIKRRATGGQLGARIRLKGGPYWVKSPPRFQNQKPLFGPVWKSPPKPRTTRPGQSRRVRLYRAFLQRQAGPLDARLHQPHGGRKAGSLAWDRVY